jgi:hypothetical protein
MDTTTIVIIVVLSLMVIDGPIIALANRIGSPTVEKRSRRERTTPVGLDMGHGR